MNSKPNDPAGDLSKRSDSEERKIARPTASEDHMIDETGDKVPDDPRTYRLQYDPEVNAELSTMIVRRIADEAGDDPTNIEPLYYTIDPELINHFPDRNPSRGALEFTYHGHDVTVMTNGEVTLQPSDE